MESSSADNFVPKRAPRKRAASVSVSKTETLRSPRRRVSKKASLSASTARPKATVENRKRESTDTERKAPTILAEIQAEQKRRKKQIIVVSVMMLLGVGASAGFGYTDKGQIDVQKTIEDRNERIRNNKTDERDVLNSHVEVPVQNSNNTGKADGGMVGRGTGGKTPQPAVESLATTTATSSEQVASSTESVEVSDTTTESTDDLPIESSEDITNL